MVLPSEYTQTYVRAVFIVDVLTEDEKNEAYIRNFKVNNSVRYA